MKHLRSLSVAGAVLGSVVLGACGSNGSVQLQTTASPTSLRTDVAAANHVLLSTADVPGFTAAPAANADPTTLQAASSFTACSGAASVLGDDSRMVMSPAYFRSQTSAVASLAFVAPTSGAAVSAMADLGQADLSGCLTGMFRTVLGLDAVPGTTAVTTLVPVPKVGDQSTMWTTTIQVTAGGQTVSAYADLTFFRTGRTVGSLFDFQVGTPFPPADRTTLLDTMAGRAG